MKSDQKQKEINAIEEFDELPNCDMFKEKPWSKNPVYFQEVEVSALALLKMVMHFHSGSFEIMGLLLGKVVGRIMVVTDSRELPVEATSIRRNSHVKAYKYMKSYMTEENVIGWYHSRPGRGYCLSSIDVSAQMLNQQFREPWLAIVVDPIRTVSSGKVSLGAFRTFSKVKRSLFIFIFAFP